MTILYDWAKVKADFIAVSLQEDKQTPISYFTNKYGMKYQTFMGKRKKQKWDADLAKEREHLAAKTNKKLKSQLSTIQADDLLDEIKVRKTNMRMANAVAKPLIREWQRRMKNPKIVKKMSLRGIMHGLEMVSKLRGKAAGLPEKIDVNNKNLNINIDIGGDHLSPADNRKQVRESEQLATDIQLLLKEFKTIDVEPSRPKKPKADKAS